MKVTGSFDFVPTPVDRSLLSNLEELDRRVMLGELHEDLTPKFDVHPFDYTKAYRTALMHFRIPALQCPQEGAGEYRAAIARMIALRAPDRPGYSDQLALNQVKIARRFRVPLHCFKMHLEKHIDRRVKEAEYPEWLERPCSKRLQRRKMDVTVRERGTDRLDDARRVLYQLKPGELLATGKKRAVADLGMLRTQATAWCFDSIKAAWSVPFRFGKLRAVYAKRSDKETLREAFGSLVNPGDMIQFYYHSDDSCVAASCSDGVVFFNGDIKACDGSHRKPVIELLRKLLREHKGVPNCTAETIDRAIGYLYRDLKFGNRHNRRQHVTYKFWDPRLYSGSVVTTTLNNLANLLIAMALQRRVPEPSQITKAQFRNAYILAGEDVGYMLKVSDCEVIEDLQFLKHSPTQFPDGEIEPWMNLGVFFRGFGTVVGDLPGRGPIESRARKHISEVVVGRSNWGDHAVNDAFLKLNYARIGMRDLRNTGDLNHDVQKSVGEAHLRIPLDSLARRYRLSVAELCALCDVVGALDIGDYYDSRVIHTLYAKDYG